MPRTKRQRHIGYILVPVVDDDGITTIPPNLWRAWRHPIDSEDHVHITAWTSMAAARKARKEIFGEGRRMMKICRIRLE